MARLVLCLALVAVAAAQQHGGYQQQQPQYNQQAQHGQYQQPHYQQGQYQQPKYQQPQYQQPQYQQPQYQPPQYHQQQYQQPYPGQHHQHQQPSKGGSGGGGGGGGHRSSRLDQRPWYYSANPTGGVGCRTGNSRAIAYATPQQSAANQQQQPYDQAGWKDPQQTGLMTPSQEQEPPQQDYYNVVVPSNEVPNYINQQQPPRGRYGGPPPQRQQQQRPSDRDRDSEDYGDDSDSDDDTAPPRYPLTPPSLKFKIGLISDLGKDSANEEKKKYKAFLKIGHLLIEQSNGGDKEGNATVEFDPENEEHNHELETGINHSGEGFELSTLNFFNGKLYACDDETGIVYELKEDEETKNFTAHPWILLPSTDEGFKCEWATVKDDHLWIGSTGVLFPDKKKAKNETDDQTHDDVDEEEDEIHDDDHEQGGSAEGGEQEPPQEPSSTARPRQHQQRSPQQKTRSKRQGGREKKTDDSDEFDKSQQYVKKITKDGRVIHVDWSETYEGIATSLGVNQKKGFVVHEAVAWSDIHQKWLFTPRRLSKTKYDKATYAKTGTNAVVWADDQRKEFEASTFGEQNETTGFTDIKFIPGTDDKLVLALKSGLDGDKLFSSLSVYDWEGKEVMKDVVVADGVYAGVEFL